MNREFPDMGEGGEAYLLAQTPTDVSREELYRALEEFRAGDLENLPPWWNEFIKKLGTKVRQDASWRYAEDAIHARECFEHEILAARSEHLLQKRLK